MHRAEMNLLHSTELRHNRVAEIASKFEPLLDELQQESNIVAPRDVVASPSRSAIVLRPELTASPHLESNIATAIPILKTRHDDKVCGRR